MEVYADVASDDNRGNLTDLKAHWDHTLGYQFGFKKIKINTPPRAKSFARPSSFSPMADVLFNARAIAPSAKSRFTCQANKKIPINGP